MSTAPDRWLLDDPRPVQSLKKATAAPDNVRAFRLQQKGPDLPEALRSLRNLEVLVLRGTELARFPAWLPELSSLRALDLGGCAPALFSADELAKLTALPQLEEIVAEFAPQPRPAAFGQLVGLRRLRLRYAKIHAIPDAWRALSSLTALDLGSNAIEDLPEFLRDLPLTALTLFHNKLRTLPAWLVASPRLSRLIVEQNQLTDLPPVPAESALVDLRLGGNPIAWSRIYALRAAMPGRRIEFWSDEPEPATLDATTSVDSADEPSSPLRLHDLPPAPPPSPRPALDARGVHELQPIALDVADVVAPPAWSPDHRWLALAEGTRVLVADVAALAAGVAPTPVCVAEAEFPIASIHFTRAHLIVQLLDGSVHAIDLARGGIVWRTEPDEASGEWQHLAAGSHDPRVVLVRRGELRVRGEDGSLLASVACDGTIRRLALAPAGQVLVERYGGPRSLSQLDGGPALVHEDPQGDVMAVDPVTGGLALGDTLDLSLAERTGARNITRRHLGAAHHEQLVQLEFSPDGAWLASAAVDGSIALWSTRDLEPARVLGGGGPAIRHVAFAPGGDMLATFDAARRVHVWAPRPWPTIAAPTALLRRFDAGERVAEVASLKLSWGLVVAPPSRLRRAGRLRVQPPPGDYRLFVAFADGLPVAALLARGTPALLERVSQFVAAARVDDGPAVELADGRLCLLDAALAHEFAGDEAHHRGARDALESQWDELGWVHHHGRLRALDAWEDRLDHGQLIGLGLDLPDGARPAVWGLSADGVPQVLLIDLATVAP